jgi:hypothetical protein
LEVGEVMLTIGQKVRLDLMKKCQGREIRNEIGWYFVHSLIRDRLYLKKDKTGYIESFQVWDFRKGRYRLVTEDNKIIGFQPLEDIKMLDKQNTDEDLREYREKNHKSTYQCYRERMAEKVIKRCEKTGNNSEEEIKSKQERGKINMLKMTKKEVLEMTAAGKTIKEIAEYFIQGNEEVRSMYIAKASLFLNGPKEGTKKKRELIKKLEISELPETTTIIPMPEVKPPKIEIAERSKPSLRTKVLEDAVSEIEFEIQVEELVYWQSKDKDNNVRIIWENLHSHILNLQEIEKMHEAM